MKKVINKLFLSLLTVAFVGGIAGSIYHTTVIVHDNYLQSKYKCSEVKGFDPSKPFKVVDGLQDTKGKTFMPCNIKTGLLSYEYRWGEQLGVESPVWAFLLFNIASWLPFLFFLGLGYWIRWLIK